MCTSIRVNFKICGYKIKSVSENQIIVSLLQIFWKIAGHPIQQWWRYSDDERVSSLPVGSLGSTTLSSSCS